MAVLSACCSVCPDVSPCRPVLMVYQSDVTQRTTLETALAKLTEIQLGMLCQVSL